MSAVSSFRPAWSYGLVAAVAISLGADGSPMETAGWRAAAIALGGTLGTVTTLVVWPLTATKRTQELLSGAIRAGADRLDVAIRAAQGEADGDCEEAGNAEESYHDLISKARSAADGILVGDADRFTRRIEHANKLYNSALIVKRVSEETDAATRGGLEITAETEELREQQREQAYRFADGEIEGRMRAWPRSTNCCRTCARRCATARATPARPCSSTRWCSGWARSATPCTGCATRSRTTDVDSGSRETTLRMPRSHAVAVAGARRRGQLGHADTRRAGRRYVTVRSCWVQSAEPGARRAVGIRSLALFLRRRGSGASP